MIVSLSISKSVCVFFEAQVKTKQANFYLQEMSVVHWSKNKLVPNYFRFVFFVFLFKETMFLQSASLFLKVNLF